MRVEDEDKDQFVIEQFYLNEDKKWRFLTVLPNELQLYNVALHDNSLYVVGGVTKAGFTIWERLSVASRASSHVVLRGSGTYRVTRVVPFTIRFQRTVDVAA